MTGVPVAGTTVLLDLSDRGRVQLGDQIGPSASRVEGIIETASDTSYLLRVSAVHYLTGQQNRWNGERLTIPASMVSTAQVQQFSRSRTTAVGVGIIAAIVTLFARTSLFGQSGADKGSTAQPGGVT